MGYLALWNNTTGSHNTGIGKDASYNNSSGSYNTGVGHAANFSVTTGTGNTSIGYSAGTSLANAVNTTALGWLAQPSASNQVRIGNSAVTSIGGNTIWSNFSDGRFKKEVKEDVLGLAFINLLRPVSYILDRDEIDSFMGVPDNERAQLKQLRGNPTREIGFIAQDVESLINSSKTTFHGVVKPQGDKDVYAIGYATFVVPLVKAVQELSEMIEEQHKMLEEQKLRIDSLSAQLGDKDLNKTRETSVGKAILFQNSPNPFSIDTEIKMELPESIRQAEVIIYNMEGTQLKSIRINDRGITEAKISAGELRPGLYIYSLIADGEVIDIKRMVLRQ